MQDRIVSISLLIIILLAGCAEDSVVPSASDARFMLDTFCTITVYAPNAEELLAGAFSLIEQYENKFSISIETSDIWRINNAGGQSVTVAPQTAELIQIAIEYGRISGGGFDITIGRLSRLWDFSGTRSVPSESEITNARETVDFTQIIVTDNTVTLLHPDAWIDLGAIAKGYIARSLVSYFAENNTIGAVIDLGGDVTLVGEKPGASHWRLGVRQPTGEESAVMGIIETAQAAVFTSGIYERMFIYDGKIYHHILDPQTGRPINQDIISITLLSACPVVADVMTSIIMLAGVEEAHAIIANTPELSGALLVKESGEIILIGDIAFEQL